ncbi:MAG: DNA-3-methyladenine glycosylase [Saprospiraceae bacterium]|nr:DNA-3-methyladenine glycosylase [Saprospiraceae bacterium]MDW8484180.1 DNA-3-methyladenine glycosylase [Saprospiraceae bacterium]
MRRLGTDFYLREDVLSVAKDLLGKVLVTSFDGQRTAGIITEVEAYRAPEDRACHAYGNRRTARTEVMFRPGGCAYIYLCYGLHHLFNIVTGPEGMAHAVLIRAIEPIEGHELMCQRRKYAAWKSLSLKQRIALTTGPGALAQALGFHANQSGQSLIDPSSPMWVETSEVLLRDGDIAQGPRIGVEYAGECAKWEWRFWIKHSLFVRR